MDCLVVQFEPLTENERTEILRLVLHAIDRRTTLRVKMLGVGLVKSDSTFKAVSAGE